MGQALPLQKVNGTHGNHRSGFVFHPAASVGDPCSEEDAEPGRVILLRGHFRWPGGLGNFFRVRSWAISEEFRWSSALLRSDTVGSRTTLKSSQEPSIVSGALRSPQDCLDSLYARGYGDLHRQVCPERDSIRKNEQIFSRSTG